MRGESSAKHRGSCCIRITSEILKQRLPKHQFSQNVFRALCRVERFCRLIQSSVVLTESKCYGVYLCRPSTCQNKQPNMLTRKMTQIKKLYEGNVKI